ncbi:MAG: hypothetical protein M5R40_28140 [Anaerolineae bacterium]|nr:hypothetical protein [Anaerolineae bacterium]
MTPTATFGIDDDINVVYVTNMDAEVTLVLTSSEGERVELDPQDAEAGVRMLNGLDWESYGEPWPVGQWTVEILVDGRPAQTLTITVEGEATGDVDTGPLSDVYTAAGDGVKPEELTATDVFTTDDDLNIVVTVSRAAEVTAVFTLPGDLSGEDGPVSLAAGESRVFGLDWESYGEPWPAGAGTVEVLVGGEVVETLTFTIGAPGGGAPGGGAPVGESAVSVYTAAGDEVESDLLTATTVFASDDDLNVVITAAGAVQVSAVFVTPTGERVDFDPEDVAAGHWQVYGLDWESFGQAWPAGKWLVEVYVNGALYETLAFRVEGLGWEPALSRLPPPGAPAALTPAPAPRTARTAWRRGGTPG